MAVYLKYGVGRPNHSTITVNNIIVFKTHMNVSAYKYIYAFLWKCIPYVNFHFMLIIIMFVEDTRLWHVLSVSTYIYIYIYWTSKRSERAWVQRRRKHEHCTLICERRASHRLIVRLNQSTWKIFASAIISNGGQTRFASTCLLGVRCVCKFTCIIISNLICH